ncbi:MAG: biotin--protein ligase [Desulfovibrionaceae bacterium]
MSSIHLLWDDAHIWGLLLHRALSHWGVEHQFVRATEIAQGALARKPRSLVLAPGGLASAKSRRLGKAGRAALREHVRGGGAYLGFCGGAGLALSAPGSARICPWERRGFSSRLHHFTSGHVVARLEPESPLIPPHNSQDILLPVWWAARFQEQADGVRPLARYVRPANDFWVADLPLSQLSAETLDEWERLYGVRIAPNFHSAPCVVAGELGKGRYVLSYSHLETPASPQANAWLAHLLGELAEAAPETAGPVPAWDLSAMDVLWDDDALVQARRGLEDILAMGQSHFLLFWRNPWLLGWRRGIPGSSLNSLYAMVRQAQAHEPTGRARDYWGRFSRDFRERFEIFRKGVCSYLLAERLSMTLATDDPWAVFPKSLKEQKNALFGPPPSSGGLYAELMGMLEELTWRQFS